MITMDRPDLIIKAAIGKAKKIGQPMNVAGVVA
jgi:hypothetical protein